MRILFVYPNLRGFHEDCYSPGLASIVSSTKADGHEVRVLVVRRKSDFSGVLDMVGEFSPKVVGFSSVSSQFNSVREMAESIKRRSRDTIIVCGGVHPTINPGCLLEAPSLDAIFVGESESSFVEFLARADKGDSYRSTDNLAYADDGNLVVNRLKPRVVDLDSLPYPDKESSPFAETIQRSGYAPFFFSRGCPFLCAYCSNHAIAQAYGEARNHPRYRSPESSIREIEEAVSKFPISTIFIEDDIFGLNKKWREEFCEKYRERIGLRFMCILRAEVLDERFARLLKRAGCCRITLGIESGNEHVRNEIMNRRMSTEQIRRAFRVAHEFGFKTNALNVIGAPGETEDMLWDTIRLNREVNPTSSGVNIFYPYRGTKLGDRCFEGELVDEKLYYAFSNERRETVLNYPEDHRKKLVYYRENWDSLVYPFDVKRRVMGFVRGTLVWKALRRLKRFLVYGS